MPVVARKLAVNEDVLEKVKEALRAQDFRPFELMAYLENQHRLDDNVVREALWELLSNFEIEFTSEQKLHLRTRRHHRAIR